MAPLPGRREPGRAAGLLVRATWGRPQAPRFSPPPLCSPQSRLGLWLLSDLFARVQRETRDCFWAASQKRWGRCSESPRPPVTQSQARKTGLLLEQLWDWGWGAASPRPTGCRGQPNIPEQVKDRLVIRTEVGDAGQGVGNTAPPHDRKGGLSIEAHRKCVLG